MATPENRGRFEPIFVKLAGHLDKWELLHVIAAVTSPALDFTVP